MWGTEQAKRAFETAAKKKSRQRKRQQEEAVGKRKESPARKKSSPTLKGTRGRWAAYVRKRKKGKSSPSNWREEKLEDVSKLITKTAPTHDAGRLSSHARWKIPIPHRKKESPAS